MNDDNMVADLLNKAMFCILGSQPEATADILI